MRSKVALITGITGQDGAYLAEFLLGKGYGVHGETFVTRKIPAPWRASSWACRIASALAIWMRNAIGATPKIMSRCSG